MKKKSRILIVATSPKTRGGITSVLNNYKRDEIWQQYKIKWLATHIDKSTIVKLLFLLKSLVTFLFIAPFYDIIHIHLSEYKSAKRKSFFFKIAKLYRRKTIIHFHAFSPKTTINGPHKNLYHYLFSKSDKVIVLSNSWKIWIEESLNLSKNIAVIYNPCPRISNNISVEQEDIILYAGTINERKGFKDLIQAFAPISKQFSNWKVVFIGNGDIKEGQKLAKKLTIENQVQFMGWVSGDLKDDIFKKSKIFCLPSYAEGFPMAVLDAWAYGLPVITTPVGGLPDVLINERNALIFKPGDINTLTTQITQMIVNDELRKNIASKSKYLANNTFNISTITSQLSNLYDALSEE